MRAAASLGLAALCAGLSGCGAGSGPDSVVLAQDRAAGGGAEFTRVIAPLYAYSECPRWTPATLGPRDMALARRRSRLVSAIDADSALRPVADAIRARVEEGRKGMFETECANPAPPYPRPEDFRERAAELDREAAEIGAAEQAYNAHKSKAGA